MKPGSLIWVFLANIAVIPFFILGCGGISYREKVVDREYTRPNAKYRTYCQINPKDINAYLIVFDTTSKNEVGVNPAGDLFERYWYLDSYNSYIKLCDRELTQSGHFLPVTKRENAEIIVQFKVETKEWTKWYTMIGMITATLFPIVDPTDIKISGQLIAKNSGNVMMKKTVEHKLISYGSLIPNPITWLFGAYYTVVSGHWWIRDKKPYVQSLYKELLIEFAEYLKTHPLDTSSQFNFEPEKKETVPKEPPPSKPTEIRM